jgi:SAM-dependent methyltransferase
MDTPSQTRNPPLSLSAWLRYDAIDRLLPRDVSRVLEIGAGLGSVGALLARRFAYTGLEPDPVSYETATERVGRAGLVLNCTAEELEVPELFDLVCAFEVLEHCEDDVSTLAGWLRHLRPGGYAMLSVPFGRDRFGAWDRRAGHYRRYDRADIVETLEHAGLGSIETIAYGFPLGSATAVARNLLARVHRTESTMDDRTAVSGRTLQPPSGAAGATRLISAPFRLLQRPFAQTKLGPGIVACGRLPNHGLAP